MKNKLNSSIGKKYKRKENNLSEARNKAILILENIADSMGDEEMFDCKDGNTTWYDLEDMITNIINDRELIDEIKLHLKDGIISLGLKTPDIKQATHNFFEIANHLGIKDGEIFEVKFKCFRCGNVYEKQYASKVDKTLCKYCEEFDDDNGELKE